MSNPPDDAYDYEFIDEQPDNQDTNANDEEPWDEIEVNDVLDHQIEQNREEAAETNRDGLVARLLTRLGLR